MVTQKGEVLNAGVNVIFYLGNVLDTDIAVLGSTGKQLHDAHRTPVATSAMVQLRLLIRLGRDSQIIELILGSILLEQIDNGPKPLHMRLASWIRDPRRI